MVLTFSLKKYVYAYNLFHEVSEKWKHIAHHYMPKVIYESILCHTYSKSS